MWCKKFDSIDIYFCSINTFVGTIWAAICHSAFQSDDMFSHAHIQYKNTVYEFTVYRASHSFISNGKEKRQQFIPFYLIASTLTEALHKNTNIRLSSAHQFNIQPNFLMVQCVSKTNTNRFLSTTMQYKNLYGLFFLLSFIHLVLFVVFRFLPSTIYFSLSHSLLNDDKFIWSFLGPVSFSELNMIDGRF